MPEYHLPLQPHKFYHIYNRGINGCALFNEAANYEYFLRLYKKYIGPVAQTYAWVLMGNHLHLLVRIKDFNNLEGLKNLPTEKRINQQFSNLFNAYTKAFNKRYQRTGSLFEHSFHRKQITDVEYLKRMVLYIHNNPVHHGFCKHPIEYPWSSYETCLSSKNTELMRNVVIDWFSHNSGFKLAHQQTFNWEDMEKWLDFNNYNMQ
jgi:REP element-mobilizing transposase RayT